MIVKTKNSYRTFHDFVMLLYFGEHKMADFTAIRMKCTNEQKEAFIKEFEKLLKADPNGETKDTKNQG